MTEKELEILYKTILDKYKNELKNNEENKCEKHSFLEVKSQGECILDKNKKIEDIYLDLAEMIVDRAFFRAKELGISITAAVVNKGGNLILLKKMDEAIIASIDVSYKKAYTSLSLNCPSSKVDLVQFPGLDVLMKDKIVLFGGGYPIIHNGKLIGAIGISGGSSEIDEEIAKYAIGAIK